MSAFLSPHLTVDAIPERKRAAGEEDESRDTSQSQEYSRRSAEPAHETVFCQAESEDASNGRTERVTTPSEEIPQKEQECPKPKKKAGAKGEKTKTPRSYGSVTNISGCSGFQIGNTYTNILHYGNQAHGKFSASSKAEDRQKKPPIPEKVFRCLQPITEEDCAIVGDYITSDWKPLGTLLFDQELDTFTTSLEGKSNKEKVRQILSKWKKGRGKYADVGKLCQVLQKLNEYTAIMKLAKRHGIE